MRQFLSSKLLPIFIAGLFVVLIALAVANNFTNRALAAHYPTENTGYASFIFPE